MWSDGGGGMGSWEGDVCFGLSVRYFECGVMS